MNGKAPNNDSYYYDHERISKCAVASVLCARQKLKAHIVPAGSPV
jgi:hypothetical protein